MKKLIALVLALAMPVAFAACSGNDDSENSENTADVSDVVEEIDEPVNIKGSGQPFEDTLHIAKVGQTVAFGSYEQDNDTANGAEPVEWTVLAIKDNYALLISTLVLDAKPYDYTAAENISWAACTLRAWLNTDLYNAVFTDADKARICDTTIEGAVTDKLFLLSENEAKAYFETDESRMAKASAYATALGAYTSSGYEEEDAIYNGACRWWLRTADSAAGTAARVRNTGDIFHVGYDIGSSAVGVRPAMWIAIR